jgi:hypothetical protein
LLKEVRRDGKGVRRLEGFFDVEGEQKREKGGDCRNREPNSLTVHKKGKK